LGRRLEAFLYSRRNIVGCLLALGGLALHFSGLVPGLIWLPIMVGLYLIGLLLVPGEQSLNLRLDAAADASGVHEALDTLMKSIQGKVPADIYAKVASIRDSILVTLGNGSGNGGGAGASMVADPNVYLIRQTAMSYLPEALNAYLALPRLYANRSLGGRKSAHDTLLDQLNLMNQKMTEVAEAMVAHDADRLEAHGRFLAEKFGGSSLDIAGAGAAQVPGSAAAGSATTPAAATPAPTSADAAAPTTETVEDRVRG
jgi:hypothetical protein